MGKTKGRYPHCDLQNFTSLRPGIHCAISVRFTCDFSKVSTHIVREDRMRYKAKAHDLCALTIRVKYSGCPCADDDTVYGR